jgi:hypothetical protein
MRSDLVNLGAIFWWWYTCFGVIGVIGVIGAGVGIDAGNRVWLSRKK